MSDEAGGIEHVERYHVFYPTGKGDAHDTALLKEHELWHATAPLKDHIDFLGAEIVRMASQNQALQERIEAAVLALRASYCVRTFHSDACDVLELLSPTQETDPE